MSSQADRILPAVATPQPTGRRCLVVVWRAAGRLWCRACSLDKRRPARALRRCRAARPAAALWWLLLWAAHLAARAGTSAAAAIQPARYMWRLLVAIEQRVVVLHVVPQPVLARAATRAVSAIVPAQLRVVPRRVAHVARVTTTCA